MHRDERSLTEVLENYIDYPGGVDIEDMAIEDLVRLEEIVTAELMERAAEAEASTYEDPYEEYEKSISQEETDNDSWGEDRNEEE